VFCFLACWQPGAYNPPAPAEVSASDVQEGLRGTPPGSEAEADADVGTEPTSGRATTPDAANPDAANPDAAAGAAPEVAEAGATEAVADAGSEAKSDFDDREVSPWIGHTLGTPLSVVDALGQPIAVVGAPGTKVTVLEEGTLRLKVRCDGCDPVVTGYVQRDRVQR
jgi:hypothetical protein